MPPRKFSYYDVFISYSHQNQTSMECVRQSLSDALFAIWTDELIQEGESWQRDIQKNLSNVENVVFLASPESYESKTAEAELDTALDLGIPISILLVKGDKRNIPLRLRQNQYIDGRGDKLKSAVRKLIFALYKRSRRQLLYRSLRPILSFFSSNDRISQIRDMIYRPDDDDNKLRLHSVYGIFLQSYLAVDFAIGEGLAGKVWEDPETPYLVADWKRAREEPIRAKFNMTEEQLDATSNLGMALAIPIFSKDYAPFKGHGEITGVLVVDSPRSLERLNIKIDSEKLPPFLSLCVTQTRQLSILLDIEDEIYPLSRISDLRDATSN
ncbi:MAG: TIR domain-containing protein [Chloroflexi bacterium]|nr:TIR domain-containing protein [Chloroflexota bacterium]